MTNQWKAQNLVNYVEKHQFLPSTKISVNTLNVAKKSKLSDKDCLEIIAYLNSFFSFEI